MSEFARMRVSDAATFSQVAQAATVSQAAASVEPAAAPAGRPYLYYNAFVVAKGHEHVRNVVRKQVHEAGFTSDSKAGHWEQFGYNDDTLAQLTSVGLPDGRTYVQVVTTSAADAPAKHWMQDLAARIQNDKSVAID